MESWVKKYLPDCDPKMFPCALDSVPEHIFFHIEDAVRETWKNYFDWQSVETKYSVIKLKSPWSRTVTDYKRKKTLKTTHALCLNGVPMFQMSQKTLDRKKVWELQAFELPSEWKTDKQGNPEGILGELDNYIHNRSNKDFYKSYTAWLGDYDSRAKEYDSISGKKRWGSTMTGFSWWLKKDYKEKKKIFKERVRKIYRTMYDLCVERKYAEQFGLPNLFYRRASLYQITATMQQERNPDRTWAKDIDYSFSEVMSVTRHTIQQICFGDEDSPTWNKKLCKFLNQLSKTEYKRVLMGKYGVINHLSLANVPIYTVEKGLKDLGWTIEDETNADVPMESSAKIKGEYPIMQPFKSKEVYREYSNAFGLQSFLDMGLVELVENKTELPDRGRLYYAGMVKTPYSTLNYWAGMLLNTMNLFDEQVEFLSFTTPIRKFAFPDTFSYSRWADKERILKTDSISFVNYPEQELSLKNGVLPPLVSKK